MKVAWLVTAALMLAALVPASMITSTRPGEGAFPGANGPSAFATDVDLSIGPALPTAPIRPLLGVNAGPLPAGDPGNADLTAAYQQTGVKLVRTHDFYGPLDMATIYPDQSADPGNPASYDFTASDRVFAAIVAGGFEPYLRIGDSWNNDPAYPAANPRRPTNRNNWIQAAVEVVRHYNDPALWGGASLRYIEIWNEPDNTRFWDGTPVEFFDLFARTAEALKAEFPSLLIGGPGLTPAGAKSPRGRDYTRAFLQYLQNQGVPLDFFSWHMYSDVPADFVDAASFYRGMLDTHGYTRTESHITEWNTSDGSLRLNARGAALMTAAWIGLQEQRVDASTFYRGNDTSPTFPTFYGLFFADGRPKPTALAFSLWADMVSHPQRLEVTPNHSPLWALAGQNDAGEIALLLANPTDVPTSYSLSLVASSQPPDTPLAVQQISDRGLRINTFSSTTARTEIGANAVQLVKFSPPPTVTPLPSPTPCPAASPGPGVILSCGWNTVVYTGATRPVEQALGNCLPSIEAVFFWDAAAQAYSWWFKGASAGVNTLASISGGAILWVRAGAACNWVQPA